MNRHGIACCADLADRYKTGAEVCFEPAVDQRGKELQYVKERNGRRIPIGPYVKRFQADLSGSSMQRGYICIGEKSPKRHFQGIFQKGAPAPNGKIAEADIQKLEDVLEEYRDERKNKLYPGPHKGYPDYAYILLAYVSMLKRDARRLENTLEVLDECPLGSGALAGTTYPLDRHFTAETLGFSRPCDNAMDGVSDRDYCLEFLSDLSILMMHLSRLSEEVISWCSWEFKFIELDDAFSTGSSIMPQKKNPDICELVRGKTGRVYGDLMTLLTVMKGLPLAYDKDMQEDKECVFDAIDTVSMCLKVLPDMLSTMTVLTENMAAAGRRGFINATDCADYLTKKGMPFRDAYKLTGGLVARCIREGRTLEQLSLEELQEESPLFDEGFYAAVDLLNAVKRRNTWGGPSPEQTQEQIALAREFVKNHRKQD